MDNRRSQSELIFLWLHLFILPSFTLWLNYTFREYPNSNCLAVYTLEAAYLSYQNFSYLNKCSLFFTEDFYQLKINIFKIFILYADAHNRVSNQPFFLLILK